MELKFRLNLEAEDVEIVFNGEVIDTIGKEIVANWVEAINEKNKPEEDAEETSEEKPVEEEAATEETEEVVEETSDETVDADESE